MAEIGANQLNIVSKTIAQSVAFVLWNIPPGFSRQSNRVMTEATAIAMMTANSTASMKYFLFNVGFVAL